MEGTVPTGVLPLEGSAKRPIKVRPGQSLAETTESFRKLNHVMMMAGEAFIEFTRDYAGLNHPVALKPAHKRGRHRGWR